MIGAVGRAKQKGPRFIREALQEESATREQFTKVVLRKTKNIISVFLVIICLAVQLVVCTHLLEYYHHVCG